jgi:Calcineurin-like phosphoesterase
LPMLNDAATNDSFTWLHITDLHCGMSDQDWLWPTLKASFFQDLSVVQESTGPIDTVIFSGDLTQTGKKEDFDRLDQILTELWEALAKQGANPTLLIIPGNHDVQWPDKLSPPHQVLKQWWNTAVKCLNLHRGRAPPGGKRSQGLDRCRKAMDTAASGRYRDGPAIRQHRCPESPQIHYQMQRFCD